MGCLKGFSTAFIFWSISCDHLVTACPQFNLLLSLWLAQSSALTDAQFHATDSLAFQIKGRTSLVGPGNMITTFPLYYYSTPPSKKQHTAGMPWGGTTRANSPTGPATPKGAKKASQASQGCGGTKQELWHTTLLS